MKASSRFVAHISIDGCKLPHILGRRGDPNMLHRLSSDNWTHLTLAGLPCGIPGIGLEIEGAIQQAPQSARHFIIDFLFIVLLIYDSNRMSKLLVACYKCTNYKTKTNNFNILKILTIKDKCTLMLFLIFSLFQCKISLRYSSNALPCNYYRKLLWAFTLRKAFALDQ